MDKRVVAHLLAADAAIPNHRRWPLLTYRGALPLSGADPGASFEELFAKNGWPAAWRNGVFPFQHYQSNAHEALGIYRGGTGHKRLSSRGRLGVVGAYSAGARPDTCMPPFARPKRNAEAAMHVPLPSADPVFGAHGPLFEHWR